MLFLLFQIVMPWQQGRRITTGGPLTREGRAPARPSGRARSPSAPLRQLHLHLKKPVRGVGGRLPHRISQVRVCLCLFPGLVKTETEMGLNEVLQTMGVVDIFTPKADFSGMADCAIGDRRITGVSRSDRWSRIRRLARHARQDEHAIVTQLVIREYLILPRFLREQKRDEKQGSRQQRQEKPPFYRRDASGFSA